MASLYHPFIRNTNKAMHAIAIRIPHITLLKEYLKISYSAHHIAYFKLIAYSIPNSAVIGCAFIKRERRGSSHFSLIPCVGSRIALYQNKQLEIAHAVIYCNIIQYTLRRRFGCVSFGTLNLRDSHTKDHVRKRPCFNMS